MNNENFILWINNYNKLNILGNSPAANLSVQVIYNLHNKWKHALFLATTLNSSSFSSDVCAGDFNAVVTFLFSFCASHPTQSPVSIFQVYLHYQHNRCMELTFATRHPCCSENIDFIPWALSWHVWKWVQGGKRKIFDPLGLIMAISLWELRDWVVGLHELWGQHSLQG